MAKELFVDATQLEEAYASGQEDEWHEWPLLSTDGDTAAILQMVSDHIVDVQFDTTNAQIARQTIDYASKKASDSEIEIRLLVQVQQPPFQASPESSPIATPMEIASDDIRGHGINAYGAKASCRLFSKGVTDCQHCIETAMVSELRRWPLEDQYVATAVMRIVSGSGSAGVPIADVMVSLKQCAAGISTDRMGRMR